MSSSFGSILSLSGMITLAGVSATGCATQTTESTQTAKGAKSNVVDAASGSQTVTGKDQTSSTDVDDGNSSPIVATHPIGAGEGGHGGPGTASPNPNQSTPQQIGANPNSGDETAENVGVLESARGANGRAPSAQEQLDLTVDSGKTLLLGNWVSSLSEEQEALLAALNVALDGNVEKVEAAGLEGDSKELAIKIAERIRIDSSQGSASSPVDEAQKLQNELQNPLKLKMQVDANTISVDGDRTGSEEASTTWSAPYSVVSADGNTLTVQASRQSGDETVDIFFVSEDQIWVPRSEGEGTVYSRDQ